MDPLAAFALATAATAVTLGGVFVILWRRALREPEHGAAALFCAAVAASAAGSALSSRPAADAAFGVAVGALLLFTLTREQIPPKRAMTLAAITSIALVAGAWSRFADLEVVTAGAVVAIYSVYSFGRGYLRGKRDALYLVLGGVVLGAVLINDMTVSLGAFASHALAPIGLFAFALAMAAAVVSRYADALALLQSRDVELRRSARKLRRSHHELKTAQEELGKKEQLAAVGELAAVVAHEVRNPLAIISNAVAGLRKAPLSREDHETLLTILDEEAQRLNRLVTDLLRYARPLSMERSTVSVRDLVDRALQHIRGRKGLDVEVEGELDKRVYADAVLLRQVFDNLFENAVQAMADGGRLTVRAKEIEGRLVLDVIDTGEGMDTMVRKRAKDPFFTTRPSGTGLGLAIVDRIVVAHGGSFLIESSSGEGTRATIELPLKSDSWSDSIPPSSAARGA